MISLKKIIFMLILIALSCSVIYASDMNLEYDGEVHRYEGPNVNLILNGEKFLPAEGQMPPIIFENRTLVPVREVFEKLGGSVDWSSEERKVSITIQEKEIQLWINRTTAMVDGKEIDLDVPAKLINAKTMVPVRFISENGGLYVGWDGTTTTVTVSTPKTPDTQLSNINSIMLDQKDDVDCIVVELDHKTTYHCFPMSDPERIILDIDQSRFAINRDPIIFSDHKILSKIRFGVQENNVNRIVLDLQDKTDYSVLENEDGTKLYIAFAGGLTIEEPTPPSDDGENQNPSTGEDPTLPPEQNEDPVIPPEEDPTLPPEENPPEENPPEENPPEEVEINSHITSVKYSTASEKARILLNGKFEYELTELQNPRRLVLDFTHSDLKIDGPNVISLKNKAITQIESLSNENGTARVVITIAEDATFDLAKKTSELQVKVERPAYRNVAYENKEDYAEIVLSNVQLSNLTNTQSKTSHKYTIKYSSSRFDTGSGTIDVNDSFIKKIVITKTKITITDTGNMKYTATQDGDNVILTLKKVDTKNAKVILLDAGHGGTDPGSHNGPDNEKVYNLAVLLKLKDMLEEEGYIVYTTREKDVTLTVDDRVTLATEDYPEADLYVSIHHNAVDNKNYTGTLVMYCPRDTSDYGITNKRFAELVLNELVSNLETINRGFIVVKETDTSKRVLTEVPMPSILCEIAFVSNDEELARIKTDEFQELAAEAIMKGIEKALAEMD